MSVRNEQSEESKIESKIDAKDAKNYLITKEHPSTINKSEKREIGDEAVWSLSSAKPGNGVEQLRDDSCETFWQSDGENHSVNIQFHKKTRISEIAFFLDYKHDESYTPARIAVRAGTSLHDLKDIALVELEEPIGWIIIPLTMADYRQKGGGGCLRAHLLQLGVLASHQSGRDTHIRQIKVYGPRHAAQSHSLVLPDFSTIEFRQFACIR